MSIRFATEWLPRKAEPCQCEPLRHLLRGLRRQSRRRERPKAARQKPLSYRGSAPFCARYATFSSAVLRTPAKNTRRTRSKHIKRQAGDAGQSRKVLIQSKERNAMLQRNRCDQSIDGRNRNTFRSCSPKNGRFSGLPWSNGEEIHLRALHRLLNRSRTFLS